MLCRSVCIGSHDQTRLCHTGAPFSSCLGSPGPKRVTANRLKARPKYFNVFLLKREPGCTGRVGGKNRLISSGFLSRFPSFIFLRARPSGSGARGAGPSCPHNKRGVFTFHPSWPRSPGVKMIIDRPADEHKELLVQALTKLCLSITPERICRSALLHSSWALNAPCRRRTRVLLAGTQSHRGRGQSQIMLFILPF